MVQAAERVRDVIPTTAKVHSVECADSFGQLSEQEAMYAYYMTRASWEGSKICWFQRSYEGPALLVILKLVFSKGISAAKAKAVAAGLPEDQWTMFMAYSAAVFNNCGNFRSFGDTKFVPELPEESFVTILRSCDAYQTHADVIDDCWARISREVYTEEDPHQHIGFPDKNGVTGYYSANVTSEDATFMDTFCQANNISPLNTRFFKSEDGKNFNLRIASQYADPTRMPYLKRYELEDGVSVDVTAADFDAFMTKLTDSIEQAKRYTANENQRNMLVNYEEHFRYGE